MGQINTWVRRILKKIVKERRRSSALVVKDEEILLFIGIEDQYLVSGKVRFKICIHCEKL